PRRRGDCARVPHRHEPGARVLARGAPVPRPLRFPADADDGGARLLARRRCAARHRRSSRVGAGLDAVHVPVQSHRAAGDLRSGWLHRRWSAGRPADRRTSARRSDRTGRGRRLRGGDAVARPAPHAVTERRKRGPLAWSGPTRWALVSLSLAATLGLIVWLLPTQPPPIRFVVRLYQAKHFLKTTVASWGWAAPLVFIGIQAMQVIIAPIPGEITGPVGGALFGTTWGMIYSTIGPPCGALVCFGLGRMWGEPLIRPWLSEHHWNKMNFIVEAEGAILCFILYLIPGFPKDIISYLFGMSPMPFWVFAVVSTIGRLPGTWISSYFGAPVGDP